MDEDHEINAADVDAQFKAGAGDDHVEAAGF